MGPNWHLLPPELLQLISEKLTTITDFVRFRAVCTTWRSGSSPHPSHLPLQLPWLILPRGPNPDQENPELDSSLSLYDLSQSKTHTLHLPEIQGKHICGSSHGWLVLEKERMVWLFNPINRDQISLPSLSAQPNSFTGTHFKGNSKDDVLKSLTKFCIRKAILSSSPRTDPNCLIMALFSGSWETAFCQIGNECWTTLTLAEEVAPQWCVVDIGYHSGLFYAIKGNGHAWKCDIRKPFCKYIASTLGEDTEHEIDYICTIEGGCDEHGLMILSRDYAYYPKNDPLSMCAILMLYEEQENWLHVQDEHTDGYTFFFGSKFHCSSLSLGNLQLNGLNGACVCYACPQFEKRIDGVDWYSCSIKIYKMEDRSYITIANQLGFFVWDKFQRYSRSPYFLWLTPTLC